MVAQDKKALSTQEVAARFNELAQQEKWFEIQEEFFADHVKVRSLRIPCICPMQKARQKCAKKEKTL